MKDKCIICGVDTPYEVSTNVDLRLYYVDGAGQLCSKCANEPTQKEEDEEFVKVPVSVIKKESNYYGLGHYVAKLYYNKLK